MAKKYELVIFIQQPDDYAEFEKLYDHTTAEAMDYLKQWDYGEPTPDDDVQTDYPYCFQGNDESYEDNGYVMVVSPRFGVCGLWRVVE